MTVDIVARTDTGRARRRNEDCVGVDLARGAAVLADGMGGLADGHLASREAVRGILRFLEEVQPARPDRPVLEAALAAANRRVRELAAERRDGAMGTTAVVMLLAGDGRCALAWVGDSRAYRYAGGKLEPLSRDHSLVQELVERGELSPEQARHANLRNVITRALGIEPDVQPDGLELLLAPGEMLLLCSDGLWDMLEDDEMARVLERHLRTDRDLTACADALIAGANEAGGLDNVSVVLAMRKP